MTTLRYQSFLLLIILLTCFFISACGPAYRASRRSDLKTEIHAGMSYEEVKSMMGMTLQGYDESAYEYKCTAYPVEVDIVDTRTKWVTFLFKDDKLVSWSEDWASSMHGHVNKCNSLATTDIDRINERLKTTIAALPPIQHIYNITVKDDLGNPVPSAAIAYSFVRADMPSGTLLTNGDGTASISVEVFAQPTLSGRFYAPDYSSHLKIALSKPGYIPKTAVTSLHQKEAKPRVLLAVLESWETYFCPELRFVDGTQTKDDILRFLNKIMLEGYIRDSELEKGSICIENFKNKKYAYFAFSNTLTFNSVRLSKYDMGERMFDEVVRKVLSPIYDVDRNQFYGVCIELTTSSKNFVDEHDTGEPVTYKFYMPNTDIDLYKNMDISGQTLLDRSIIVMDDERIELKLQ